MELKISESGYLYAIPDKNIDIKDIRLNFAGEGFNISFNNDAEQAFVDGMKIPTQYHKKRYLLISLHKDGKRYNADTLPMTSVTLLGGPYEDMFPQVIAEQQYIIEQLLKRMDLAEEDITKLKEVGDII